MQICYVIINPAYPDWCKIGFTKQDIKKRLQTYQTCSPFRDFTVFYQHHCSDAKSLEQNVIKNLKEMCGGHNHEWFRLSPELAVNIIETTFDDMNE